MHTVIDAQCTGCELCVPACPVDCIAMQPASGTRTGWQAWSQPQADEARERYEFRQQRLVRDQRENDERLAAKARAKLADLAAHSKLTEPAALDAKRAVIEAALRRAAEKRQAATATPTAPVAPTDEA
jgi:electron transport complex protein RnfB